MWRSLSGLSATGRGLTFPYQKAVEYQELNLCLQWLLWWDGSQIQRLKGMKTGCLSFAIYENKKPAPNKNAIHSGEPWKGPCPVLNPLPTQAPPWNLRVGSLLVRIPVIDSFPLIGSLPSALALLVLYKPSFSLPCHFSPGNWDSMFLRNVGTGQHINTTPKPKNKKTR
jgi:hypothetical protein